MARRKVWISDDQTLILKGRLEVLERKERGHDAYVLAAKMMGPVLEEWRTTYIRSKPGSVERAEAYGWLECSSTMNRMLLNAMEVTSRVEDND